MSSMILFAYHHNFQEKIVFFIVSEEIKRTTLFDSQIFLHIIWMSHWNWAITSENIPSKQKPLIAGKCFVVTRRIVMIYKFIHHMSILELYIVSQKRILDA